jgi:hypothetical protein
MEEGRCRSFLFVLSRIGELEEFIRNYETGIEAT